MSHEQVEANQSQNRQSQLTVPFMHNWQWEKLWQMACRASDCVLWVMMTIWRTDLIQSSVCLLVFYMSWLMCLAIFCISEPVAYLHTSGVSLPSTTLSLFFEPFLSTQCLFFQKRIPVFCTVFEMQSHVCIMTYQVQPHLSGRRVFRTGSFRGLSRPTSP